MDSIFQKQPVAAVKSPFSKEEIWIVKGVINYQPETHIKPTPYIQPCPYETKKMIECHRLEGSGTDINYMEFGTQNFLFRY